MNAPKKTAGNTICHKSVFEVQGLEFSGPSQKFKCTICGKIHGGVYSATVCQQCYAKGYR